MGYNRGMHKAIKPAKKIAVFIIGATLIVIGVLLLVLPGPGVLVLFIGLLVLATEFEWAAKHRDRAKEHLNKLKNAARQQQKPKKK